MNDNFAFPPFSKEFIDTLHAFRHAIVVGHMSPDGDCFSSEIAMEHLLKSIGYTQVFLANAGPFERAEAKEMQSRFHAMITDDMLAADPLIVMVDCGEMSRIGSLAEKLQGRKFLVLDHHTTSIGKNLGPSYILPASASTTLIIMKLYKQLGVPLTEEIATALFFGFATDTGFFKFIPKGNGEAVRMAAQLIEIGADPQITYARMSSGKDWKFIQNTALLINRTIFLKNGEIALSCFCRTDEGECPSDNYYEQIFKTDGIKSIILLKETDVHTVVLGLRSSYDSAFDVAHFALTFGGGGHVKAAGATLDCSLEEAKERVLAQLELQYGK
ncbi:MAG: DHH family phosphoesterase [Spirochaetia bacterium]|jgi:phosphoesterase RecJ-like protein|nr:DHH family phosphoesterase [Spirochaetia bacterium]